ncbi:hypothetical protein CDEST_12941 [Colletotrichum destructivum]|uniref:Uncharacterized protein n=1 Tax=Colletotrichum destructivum TaxID=34406 RepID=A0AAX4IXJ6_9PEZI|nr:hypothetical protein CDEST_12941 [Colletotrichum destructivum]
MSVPSRSTKAAAWTTCSTSRTFARGATARDGRYSRFPIQRAVDSSQEKILFVVPNLQPGLHRRAAVPMREGCGWDVPQISKNGTMILPGFVPPLGQIINILGRMCEQPQQTKTSTTIRAQKSRPSQPTARLSARPDANQNEIKCFGSGHKIDNTRLRLGIDSFCSNIGFDAKGVGARGLNDRAATGELTGGYKREDTKTLENKTRSASASRCWMAVRGRLTSTNARGTSRRPSTAATATERMGSRTAMGETIISSG